MSAFFMSRARTGAVRMSIVVVLVLLAVAAFSGALLELINRWSRQEEYSHGFLIPIIVLWLLWARRDALIASVGEPSWIGPVLILFAAIMHLMGELSAFFLVLATRLHRAL